jgi:hypothetical protein
MHFDYPTGTEPATAEWVLNVFRDFHRQSAQFDPEVYFEEELTFDTTIVDWREQCDLLPCKELGRYYNKFFEIDLPDSEWRAVLEPEKSKTIGDVCALVAKHAVRPSIRPACLLGPPCHSAGAFLTVRGLLYRNGAAVDEISPSTELAEYSRHNVKALLEGFARIAPGVVPPVRISTPLYDRLCYCAAIAYLALVVSGFRHSPIGAFFSFIAILGFHLAINDVARNVPPKSVEFGELKTFRDLAMLLAHEGAAGAGARD